MIIDFKLNGDHSYPEIENNFSDENYEIKELGENIIGANFIVVQNNNNGMLHSFILIGYNSKLGNIYKLIFKD